MAPWNARRALGTRLGALNSWNARRAILYCLLAGDIISVLIRSALRRSAPSGTREAQLEQPLASGTTAGLFCIVRWQEILSPSYYPLERAKRNWNGPPGFWNAPWRNWNGPWPMNALQPLEQSLGSTWNARRGLVKNHYYTRATHGIVEVMWSNRGAFVERGFLSERRRSEALQVSDPR